MQVVHANTGVTDTMSRPRGNSIGGTLRIVAGSLRGSRLAVPDAHGLRPTPDRVRETLFNWLAPVIDGARCLDLFAGTGALGIEALSRGASECVFVERDRTLCRLLQENLARLKVTNAQVTCDDASGFLTAQARPFDVVFLDPPFTSDSWTGAIAGLEACGWLGANAFIHVESPPDAAIAVPPNWNLHREGQAGTVRYALYRRLGADPLS
jgi:16S rRNA (guanine966-N2)-methyltransferase